MNLRKMIQLINRLGIGCPEQGGAALLLAIIVTGLTSAAILSNFMRTSHSLQSSKTGKEIAMAKIANDFGINYVNSTFDLSPSKLPGIFPDPYFLKKSSKYPIVDASLVNNVVPKMFSNKSYYNENTLKFTVKTPELNNTDIVAIYDKNVLYGTTFDLSYRSRTVVNLKKALRNNPDYPLHINQLEVKASTSYTDRKMAVKGMKGTTVQTEATIFIPAPVPTPILQLTSSLNGANEINEDQIKVNLLADGVVDFCRVYLVSETDGRIGEPIDLATAKDANGFPTHKNNSIFAAGELLGKASFGSLRNGTYTIYGQAIGVDGLVTTVKKTVVVNSPPVFVEQKIELPEVIRYVDYLFILDNSGSMAQIIEGVRKGFESIEDPSIYPQEAKLAVMNSMPADPDNVNKVLPEEREYDGREFEPGFMQLIDEVGINQFQNKGSTRYGMRFDYEGCGKWFDPGEVNDDGIPCIEAHTQISGGTSYEAGKIAFSQIVQKKKNLFRTNALVNVIFISDTHDPGRDSRRIEELSNSLDYATLLAQTNANNTIDALKFHAIAPGQPCNGENSWGLSYFPLVTASGGHKTEFCNRENYRSFLESMLDKGAQEDITVLLDNTAPIHKVFVDGTERTNYVRSGSNLTIKDIRRTGKTVIRVIYQIN